MKFLNIAHRGASIDAPENTPEAFRLALEQGADMIETDLHLTRDRAIALHHDATLGGVEIGEFPLAELRVRAPAIPTLEEALDLIEDRIPFNLELKTAAESDYEGLEARVLEEVQARGLLQRTLFSSFSVPVLTRLRALEPKVRIGLLASGTADSEIDECARDVGAEAVHLHWSQARRERIEKLHELGFRVHVYTVDDPEHQRRLLEWQVDGIFTNAPARLHALLNQ